MVRALKGGERHGVFRCSARASIRSTTRIATAIPASRTLIEKNNYKTQTVKLIREAGDPGRLHDL